MKGRSHLAGSSNQGCSAAFLESNEACARHGPLHLAARQRQRLRSGGQIQLAGSREGVGLCQQRPDGQSFQISLKDNFILNIICI